MSSLRVNGRLKFIYSVYQHNNFHCVAYLMCKYYGFNNLADTCILYVVTGILRYRESSSSTYPPWSLPCRCTDGCNTDTGDCLNGGTCIPDRPVGYTWGGQACRYGKIWCYSIQFNRCFIFLK